MSEQRRRLGRGARALLAGLGAALACGGDVDRPSDPAASDVTPGEGTGVAPTAPHDVAPRRIGALAAGGDATFARFSHTCAVVDDALQCWGANGSGQLGDGAPSARAPLPVRVAGLSGSVSAVAGGGSHTCALVEGRVFCWGRNDTRQLGAERPAVRITPEVVQGLPGPVTAVVAGRRHSCAIASGALWCWGTSEFGELGFTPGRNCRGVYAADPCTEEPGPVPDLPEPVQAAALGATHSCALAADQVFCWGHNPRGQLGDGEVEGRVTPRAVRLPGPVRTLAAGADHSCAGLDDGVWCWGANDAGQLGDGSRTDRTRPVRVAGLDAAPERLAAGGTGTCAAVGGDIYCWGSAATDPARASVAWQVAGLGGAAGEIAVGVDHACVVVDGARVRCWGDNDFGQLGDGAAPRESSRPVIAGPWDAGGVRDINRDGQLSVACLGDSNTHRDPGASPGWCERLEELLSEGPAGSTVWRTVNRGWGGAAAVDGALRPARQQLRYSLENDRPDLVVMAYGTNDLLRGAKPAEVFLAYVQHRQRVRASGAAFFVATTPPAFPETREVNAAIVELNAMLREHFPEDRVIDFDSGAGKSEFRDGIHVNDAGHERRARAAAARLAVAASPAAVVPATLP